MLSVFHRKEIFRRSIAWQNFEQVFNSANQTLRFGYNNTVWVPAKRVNGKWIQQTREMINAKFLVNDEIEKNENQKNFDCIFFHPVQRKFLLDTCLIGRYFLFSFNCVANTNNNDVYNTLQTPPPLSLSTSF